MKTEILQDVLAWIRSTDLVEVSYKEEGQGFALSTASDGAPPPGLPPGRFVPVAAPAVGLFRWSEPGRARAVEEGGRAAAGAPLGVIETAKGRFTPVPAPCAGVLARSFVEEGQAVEFGQPLFFLEQTAGS